MTFAELYSCSTCNLYTSYIPKRPEPELQKFFCMHCGKPNPTLSKRFIHIDSDSPVTVVRDHTHKYKTLRNSNGAVDHTPSRATVAKICVLCTAVTSAILALMIISRTGR